jgi:hypothetical protein
MAYGKMKEQMKRQEMLRHFPQRFLNINLLVCHSTIVN